jgi:hypothetical protein
MKSLSFLVLATVFLVSCQHARHRQQVERFEVDLLKPGMTALEVMYLEGKPDLVHTGVMESIFVYGEVQCIFRNGRLSHTVLPNETRYAMLADTIKVVELKGRKIFVAPKNRTDSDDIYFTEYVRIFSDMLSARGLAPVKDPRVEKDIESQEVPTVSYAYQRSTTSSTNYFDATGSYKGQATTFAGGGWTPTLTSTQQIKTRTTISHSRNYSIEAISRDAYLSKKFRPSWKVTVQSDGSSRDKRETFIAITSFASKLLGTDSKGEFSYFVAKNDPFIAYLSGNKLATNHYEIAPKSQLVGLTIDFTKPENLNVLNRFGQSVLSLAADVGSQSIVSALLVAGADANFPDADGSTPLFSAFESENFDVIKSLLAAKADPNHQDQSKNAPLFIAAKLKNSNSLKLLLKEKADPNIVNSRGRSPMVEAAVEGQFDNVRLLLTAGGNPNLRGSLVKPVLAYAAEGGDRELTDLLLKAGADPEARYSNGRSGIVNQVLGDAILDSARRSRDKEIVQLITKYIDEKNAAIKAAETSKKTSPTN